MDTRPVEADPVPAPAGDDATEAAPGTAPTEVVRPSGLGAGDVLGDRYRLVDRLGAGGMGEVWEARHTIIDQSVAVKVLLGGTSHAQPGQLDRFLREAKAMAAISHRHIVHVQDFGHTETGDPYIVMERLRGQALNEMLRDGPLSWEEARPILEQITDALAFAHDKGIVHRDLKPSNIFIEEGEPVHAKLIDFGIAKLTTIDDDGSTFTQTGAILGTPAYMSPEQVSGAPADERSDLYSLGCVMYEMLTGQKVFIGERATGVLFQHVFEPPMPPSKRAPDAAIDREVEAIILRALRKDPNLRFESAAAMRDAIGAVGTGAKPVTVPDEQLPQVPAGVRSLYATAATMAEHRAVSPIPGAPGSRRKLAVPALLGVLSAGGLAMFLASPDKAPPSEAPATAPAAVESSTIQVEVSVTPTTAEIVRVGGAVVPVRDGRARLELPRAQEALRLQVRAPDHEAQDLNIIPDQDQKLTVVLAPVPSVPPPPEASGDMPEPEGEGNTSESRSRGRAGKPRGKSSSSPEPQEEAPEQTPAEPPAHDTTRDGDWERKRKLKNPFGN